ncbi:Piso0_002367 [Millerozyma farinosa CBS 7064]|uniref:Piso0_002367 protein n=1 Tax=Pichia sorbitophila (strain ATCC MYA-4447 / BCRC 22081 / CBS 7064 / NBRC 10061 / NRRL Y-12695) TaxID=559304 RepID=G8YCF2_PICSO|nr:Piso0_002367 [Millerozyma farinosa CBS 7064]
MTTISIGDRVLVRGQRGEVRFVGNAKFAPGTWIGIELDNAVGKNDGSLNGVRYFECKKKDGNYGAFVRESLIELVRKKEKVSEQHNIKNTVNKLQTELKNTKHELNVLQNEAETLRYELSVSQDKCGMVEERAEIIETEKDYLEDRVESLSKNLGDVISKYEETKVDFQLIAEEVALKSIYESEVIQKLDKGQLRIEDYELLWERHKDLEAVIERINGLAFDDYPISYDNRSIGDPEVSDRTRNLEDELSKAKETITYLKHQLDILGQSEQIIETLTVSNDELTSKVASLEKSVEELTELHELDKSLEENQTVIENQLKQEIKDLKNLIEEDQAAMNDLKKANSYLEKRIESLKSEENSQSLNDMNRKLHSFEKKMAVVQDSGKTSDAFKTLTEANLRSLEEIGGFFPKEEVSDSLQFYQLFLLKLCFCNNSLKIVSDELFSNFELRYGSSDEVSVSMISKVITFYPYISIIYWLYKTNISLDKIYDSSFEHSQFVDELMNYSGKLLGIIDNNFTLSSEQEYEWAEGVEVVTSWVDVLADNVDGDTKSIARIYLSILKIIHYLQNAYMLAILTNGIPDDNHEKSSEPITESASINSGEIQSFRDTIEDIKTKSSHLFNPLTDIKPFIPKSSDVSLISSFETELEKYMPHILRWNQKSFAHDDYRNEYQNFVDSGSLRNVIILCKESIYRTINSLSRSDETIGISMHDIAKDKLDKLKKSKIDITRLESAISRCSELEDKITQYSKERDDLHINIELLEKSLTSSNKLNKRKIQELMDELKKFKDLYSSLQREYDDLKKVANSGDSNNIDFSSEKASPDKESIGTEQDASNDSMAKTDDHLKEEISILKRINRWYEKRLNQADDDLTFLSIPLTCHTTRPKQSYGIDNSSVELRSLVQNIPSIKLPNRSSWRRKEDNLKYCSAISREKIEIYKSLRNNAFRSSINNPRKAVLD